MFNTLLALGTVALQLFIVAVVLSVIVKSSFASWVAKNATVILRVVFVGAALGSLIYQYHFSYPPCILCWYQRLAIFSIAILLFTSSFAKSALLRSQVLILGFFGLAVAIFHNIIDIFQISNLGTCGAVGPSCLARYVHTFGYITIPMMSFTVLLAGVVVALLIKRYPQQNVAGLENRV
ncbi:MAG TPA: disulfide bond formation protein B [Candidatus Paceibacterota bacterium]|nr:disulfide bond formation protein B [Candidatus Paceibacterota bacterium]